MRLRGVVLGGLVIAVFALPAAKANANSVAPWCTSANVGQVACAGWHSRPVTVHWTWDPPPGTEDGTDGCDTQTVSQDTPPPGVSLRCTVTWGTQGAFSVATVLVDTTPPVVGSATPVRGPDHDGWYNKPAVFRFSGADATSGIASCDSVTYAGPDGSPAGVTGGCTDLAGNRGLASFPLFFDDTPPAPATVQEAPGNRSIRLSWVAPPDAATVRVARSAPATGARASKVIYRGTGSRLTDRHLKNGVRYRYAITVFDQAGNSTVSNLSATPTSLSLRPLPGTLVQAPPRLTWKRTRGADYYNVQLFRGKHKVLSAWPHGPHLQLKQAWKYHGRVRRLKPGLYRWYVWPGFGNRAAHRYGGRLGGSSFRVR